MSAAFNWTHLAADHDRRANLHRPADATALAEEIARLAQTGLKAVDIATALRLDLLRNHSASQSAEKRRRELE